MHLEASLPHVSHERARSPRLAPIDHAHLALYTMGNRALEIEVLDLFAGQAPLTLGDLRKADSPKAWHMAAHTLKGSARAVGAFELAEIAAEAEIAGFPSVERPLIIERLERSVAAACAYIGGLSCPA